MTSKRIFGIFFHRKEDGALLHRKRMKEKMKHQFGWTVAMILTLSMLAVAAAGCGKQANKTENKTVTGSAAVTAPSEGELSKADLKTLEELKLIAGIQDYTIEAGTKLKMSDLISFNKDYISKVEVKEDQADYSKPGQYKLKYLLSMDIKKIRKLAKEKGKSFSFSEDKGKKAFITFTNTVLEKGDPAIADNKDVITEETVKTVIASNEAWISTQESKSADAKNNAGQSVSQNTQEQKQKPSEKNEGNAAHNNNTQNTQNNNSNTQPQNTAPAAAPEPVTENVPAHQHSFDTVISEKAANCYWPGETVRQCSCGELFTETTPPLGHSWMDISYTEQQGKWVVEEGQSWNEGHWEPRTIVSFRCTRCGQTTPTPY